MSGYVEVKRYWDGKWGVVGIARVPSGLPEALAWAIDCQRYAASTGRPVAIIVK